MINFILSSGKDVTDFLCSAPYPVAQTVHFSDFMEKENLQLSSNTEVIHTADEPFLFFFFADFFPTLSCSSVLK